MFKCIYKDKHSGDNVCYGTCLYYSTIEDAMSEQDAIGYKEVKIMIKE